MPYGETLIRTQIKTLILTFKFFLTTEQTKIFVPFEFSMFENKSLCLCASACLNYNMEISLRRMSLCNLLLSWQFTFQSQQQAAVYGTKIIQNYQKIYSKKFNFIIF